MKPDLNSVKELNTDEMWEVANTSIARESNGVQYINRAVYNNAFRHDPIKRMAFEAYVSQYVTVVDL